MCANMEFDDVWDISRTHDYVVDNGYSRVTLQFPDDMLEDAPLVAGTLQQHLAQGGSAAQVYVLADTSYNPLSVDEVAAAHVQADCVIHYGYASLHPVSRIPALCVLPKAELDVQQCSQWAAQQIRNFIDNTCSSSSSNDHDDTKDLHHHQQQCAVVCCDQSYLHLLPQLKEAMMLACKGPLHLVLAESAPLELRPPATPTGSSNRQQHLSDHQQQQSQPSCQRHGTSCSEGSCSAASGSSTAPQQQVATTCTTSSTASQCSHSNTSSDSGNCQQGNSSVPPSVGGLVWQLPQTVATSSSKPPGMIWLGPADSPALLHLQLTLSTRPWLLLHPETRRVHQGLSPGVDRLLKRRYYLVERTRSATMIGLLVGTLGAAGYLQALTRLRELAHKAGKKTYTLLMGKPNPAKLANFPEIEVFVMLADPQGLILDSKEYLNPIITPHEAFLAFTDRQFEAADYKLDFSDLLVDDKQQGQQQQEMGLADSTFSRIAKVDGAVAHVIAGNVAETADSSDDEQEKSATESMIHKFGSLVLANTTGGAKAVGCGSRTGQQVQVQSAAQYLQQHRSYKGLETPATGGELLPAELAVPGRSGRAAGYMDEPAA